MNTQKAKRLALKALKSVAIGEPADVADTTVLFLNDDKTWSVCDNGEEIVCRSKMEALRIIIENLTHNGQNRDYTLRVRLTAVERFELEAMANAGGQSLSEYVRSRLFSA